jgi:hypothetical protein
LIFQLDFILDHLLHLPDLAGQEVNGLLADLSTQGQIFLPL